MPAQDCVRCEQRAKLPQSFSAQDLAFDSQPSSLVVGQQDTLWDQLLFEYLNLRTKVLDHFLLLAIHPARRRTRYNCQGRSMKSIDQTEVTQ